MKGKIDRYCEQCQEIAEEFCRFDEWPICIHDSVEPAAITQKHPNDKAQNSEARTDGDDGVIEEVRV